MPKLAVEHRRARRGPAATELAAQAVEHRRSRCRRRASWRSGSGSRRRRGTGAGSVAGTLGVLTLLGAGLGRRGLRRRRPSRTGGPYFPHAAPAASAASRTRASRRISESPSRSLGVERARAPRAVGLGRSSAPRPARAPCRRSARRAFERALERPRARPRPPARPDGRRAGPRARARAVEVLLRDAVRHDAPDRSRAPRGTARPRAPALRPGRWRAASGPRRRARMRAASTRRRRDRARHHLERVAQRCAPRRRPAPCPPAGRGCR